MSVDSLSERPHVKRYGIGPVQLWVLSRKLLLAGHPRLAKLVKGLNFLLFKAVLPPQVDFQPDVQLGHQGVGVVIHPKTIVGSRVHFWHGVTVANDNMAFKPHDYYVIIGDDVTIGTGAVLTNKRHGVLRIGDGATIGANAVVTRDVAPGDTVI